MVIFVPDYVRCSAQFEQIAAEISAVSLPECTPRPSSPWSFSGDPLAPFFLIQSHRLEITSAFSLAG
jgi:hypothetical protein